MLSLLFEAILSIRKVCSGERKEGSSKGMFTLSFADGVPGGAPPPPGIVTAAVTAATTPNI